MSSIQRRLIAATLVVISGPIHALGLGDINMKSALNQQLDASIPIELGRGESLNTVNVRMAPESEFLKAGIEFSDVLFSIDIEVEGTANSIKPSIKLSSSELIREPFLSFLLDVSWAGGRMVREYTVLLDPPALQPYLDQKNLAAETPVYSIVEPEIAVVPRAQTEPKVVIGQVKAAPVVVEPLTETIITEQIPIASAQTNNPVVASESATSANSVVSLSDLPDGELVPLVSTSPVDVEPSKIQKIVNRRSTAPTTKASSPSNSQSELGGNTVKVSREQTLWSIAEKHRSDPKNISMDQMLVALYKANPDAFDGNMNRVRTGSILRIPSRSEVLSTSAADAKKIVTEQKRTHRTTPLSSPSQKVATQGNQSPATKQATKKPEPVAKKSNIKTAKDSVRSENPTEPSEAGADATTDTTDASESVSVVPLVDSESNKSAATTEAPKASKSSKGSLAALAALAEKSNAAEESASESASEEAGTKTAPDSTAAVSKTAQQAEDSPTPQVSENETALGKLQRLARKDAESGGDSSDQAVSVTSDNRATGEGSAAEMLDAPMSGSTYGDLQAGRSGNTGASEVLDAGDSGATYGQLTADSAPADSESRTASGVDSVMDGGSSNNPAAEMAAAKQGFEDAIDTLEAQGELEQEAGPYHDSNDAADDVVAAPVTAGSTTADNSEDTGGTNWGMLAGIGGGLLALIGLLIMLMRRAGKKESKTAATSEKPSETSSSEMPAIDDVVEDELSMDLEQTEVDMEFNLEEEEVEADSDKTAIMDSTQIQEAMEEASELSDVADDSVDLESDTVSLELDADDPVSEADFHLAYGLYDEAALLLSQALENQPERHDIRVKLLEAYFAAGKEPDFLEQASILKEKVGTDASEWQKVNIMGQQLCPSSPMFAAATDAGADADVDIDFGLDEGSAEIPEPDLDFSLDGEEPAAAEKNDSPEDASLGDTVLEQTIAEPSDSFEASADAAEPSAEQELDATIADSDSTLIIDSELTVDDVSEPEIPTDKSEEATAEGIESEPTEADSNDIEFDLGDFDISSLDSDDAQSKSTASISDNIEEPGAGDDVLADLSSELSIDTTESDSSADSIDLSPDPDGTSLEDLEAQLAAAGEAADSAAAIGGDEVTDVDAPKEDSSSDFGELNLDDLDLGNDPIADSDDDQPIGEGDEIGTKLDLARAYVDMSEPDMARGMLEEVIAQGSDEQKAEATELLNRL